MYNSCIWLAEYVLLSQSNDVVLCMLQYKYDVNIIYISTAGFVKMAVISSMWCVVGLCALLISVSCDESCPTWLQPSRDGKCVCLPLYNWVVCENETQVGVLEFHCLTSNGYGSNTSVVGRCLAAVNHGERLLSQIGLYNKVLGNLSEQEEQTCGYLNCQGRLCGKCKPNHFVSAYSYDIKCHPCTCTSSVWRSVAEYVCIADLSVLR